MIKIASCQYQMELLPDWQQYQRKIEEIVEQAKTQDVQLLLLPEYAGTEIACKKFKTEVELFDYLQPLIKKYLDFYQILAKQFNMYIQPGTIIEKIAPAHFVNRAYLISPNGVIGYQDKLQLTEFEKTIPVLKQGEQQTLFDTSFGKIGIAICYDSEFPEYTQKLVHAGAMLILVPSYTSSLAGYHRVSLCCRARAIENQCYIAVSYVVNKVDLSGNAENTFGQAAIFGPADNDFPDDGVVALGDMNRKQLITADISFEKIIQVRKNGQVHNFEDTKEMRLSNRRNINIKNSA